MSDTVNVIDTNVNEIKPAEPAIPIKHIPKIFMLKANENWVIKVSYEKHYHEFYGKGYLNGYLYISRTGLTFSGVLKYDEGELRELRGIYYFSSRKSIVFMSKSKMSRNVEEMKDIIKEQIQKLNIKNAIIEFDNWRIIINTEYKIKKAPLIQFTNTIRQGNLHINIINRQTMFVPLSESYTYPVEENNTYFYWIYNHKITCNLPFTISKPLFTSGGQFAVIDFTGIPEEVAVFEITSPDHPSVTVSIRPNQESLIVYHPIPLKHRITD